MQVIHGSSRLSPFRLTNSGFSSNRYGPTVSYLTVPYKAREDLGEDATIVVEERYGRYGHRSP